MSRWIVLQTLIGLLIFTHAYAQGTPARYEIVVTNRKESGPEVKAEKMAIVPKDIVEMSPEEYRELLYKYDPAEYERTRLKYPSPLPTLKHFGTETVYFQIILGAVAVQQTMTKLSATNLHEMLSMNPLSDSAKNPVALDHFLDSLVDPVGHAAFYNFMVANKFVTDWLYPPRPINTSGRRQLLTKAEINAEFRRARMERVPFLRALLPGIGMSVGSIASHLTGDFFALMKACHQETIKKGQERLAGYQYKTHSLEQTLACNAAWKEWTDGKKFHQYAPAITSMLIATAGGTAVNMAGRALIKTTDTVSARRYTIRGLSNFAIRGFNIGITLTPGGWAIRGIKLIGHAANIGIFIYLDNLVRESVEIGMGNVLKSADVGGPAGRGIIPGKNFVELNEELTALMRTPPMRLWAVPNPDILTFLNDFSEDMEHWREISNKDAENAHNMWRDKTNGFISSTRLTLHYYSKFIDDLKGMEQVKNNILPTMIPNNLALRTYPFYGVKINHEKGNYESYEHAISDNLDNPEGIEKLQRQAVHERSEKFCKGLKELEPNLYDNESKFLNDICALFRSKDDQKTGQAIIEINKKLGLPERWSSTLTTEERAKRTKMVQTPVFFQKILSDFRGTLGDPYPLMKPMEGLAYAFEVHMNVRKHKESFNLESLGPYKMEKISDFMAYKMVCGAESPFLTVSNRDGFRMRFNPPKIVSVKPKDFCFDTTYWNDFNYEKYKSAAQPASLPSSYFYMQKIETDKGIYNGIGNLILENLNSEMKKIIEDQKDYKFETWWNQHHKPNIVKGLDILGTEYRPVQNKIFHNLYQADHKTNVGPVANALLMSLRQEMRVNLLVQGELFRYLLKAKERDPEFLTKWVTEVNLFRKQQEDKKSPLEYAKFLTSLSPLGLFSWSPNDKILELLKGKTLPFIFAFQGAVEEMMDLQEGLLLDLVSNAPSAEPLSMEEYQNNIKKLEEVYEKAFGQFEKTQHQELVLQATVSNIERILNQYQHYIEMSHFLRKYDGTLTNDNALKKPKPGAGGVLHRSQ